MEIVNAPADFGQRKTRKQVNRLPLQLLTEGKGFYIDDPAQYKSTRASVSQYNQRNQTSIKCCTMNDGRLFVGIPAKDISAAVEASPETNERPTQFELLQWLASQPVPFTHRFSLAYKHRWDEFSKWIDDSALVATIERSETELVITIVEK